MRRGEEGRNERLEGRMRWDEYRSSVNIFLCLVCLMLGQFLVTVIFVVGLTFKIA